MFKRMLVPGRPDRRHDEVRGDVIGEELVRRGLPGSALILEHAATNTGENGIHGRRKVAEMMDVSAIRSVLVIGKVCSTRRYPMTLQRHWPGLRLSVCPVNYFGVPVEHWHEHDEFRERVLGEYAKIPLYLQQGFLEDITSESFLDHQRTPE